MNRPDFLPKDTTPLRCGTETINVYPRLSAMAEDEEKSHAFHVTSASLNVATFIKPKVLAKERRTSIVLNKGGNVEGG